mmetsp:Transcript_11179/g.48300  ORF Transcript_11179/g.48300 Transcript_11179/m.48300 type:complete len:258 (-) Transcript_11179:622-1395(-)
MHSSAILCDSAEVSLASVLAPGALAAGPSASGSSTTLKNASSWSLRSWCITMYICSTVAALAASTGGLPAGATASTARDRSSCTSFSSAGCLAKSSPDVSSEESTSCSPKAHIVSAFSSAGSSREMNEHANRKISRTHARPKGSPCGVSSSGAPSATALGLITSGSGWGSPPVAPASSASPSTAPSAPFVSPSTAPSTAPSVETLGGAGASMWCPRCSTASLSEGSRLNTLCTISRSVCLERLRRSADSLPLWCPIL